MSISFQPLKQAVNPQFGCIRQVSFGAASTAAADTVTLSKTDDKAKTEKADKAGLGKRLQGRLMAGLKASGKYFTTKSGLPLDILANVALGAVISAGLLITGVGAVALPMVPSLLAITFPTFMLVQLVARFFNGMIRGQQAPAEAPAAPVPAQAEVAAAKA